MKIEDFDVHIRELESVAIDLDELARNCISDYMEQALLNKAARIYDVLAAIRLKCRSDSGMNTVLRIQQVLRERGLSQAKAARMADVNDTSMSRIVRGIEPAYPKRGKRIAEALGWEGDWKELFEEVEVNAND